MDYEDTTLLAQAFPQSQQCHSFHCLTLASNPSSLVNCKTYYYYWRLVKKLHPTFDFFTWEIWTDINQPAGVQYWLAESVMLPWYEVLCAFAGGEISLSSVVEGLTVKVLRGKARFLSGYGSTEAGMLCGVHMDPKTAKFQYGLCGKPNAGVEIKVEQMLHTSKTYLPNRLK